MSTVVMLPGEVFATFDTQDSGNISYGVRVGDRQFFVKTAGRLDKPEHAARVAWLRNAVEIAGSSSHRALSALDHVIEAPSGHNSFTTGSTASCLAYRVRVATIRRRALRGFAPCQRPRSRQH
jgi:hypothetical protein